MTPSITRIGLAVWLLFLAEPFAFAQPVAKVGVVLPFTGPFAVSAPNSFADAINAAFGGQAEVIFRDSTGQPDRALEQVRRLAEQDQVDIVIGPLGTGSSLAVAEAEISVPTISLASPPSRGLEARIGNSPFVVAFSALPDLQERILQRRLDAGFGGSQGRAIIAGPAQRSDLMSVDVFRNAGLTDIEEVRSPDGLLNALQAFDVVLLAGITGKRTFDDVQKVVQAADLSSEVLLFAPPPFETKLVAAARIAGAAWSDLTKSAGQRPSSKDYMAALRSAPRFDGERRSYELFWSILMLNSAKDSQDENRIANMSSNKRTGDTSRGENQSDGTFNCSCKDDDGEMVQCVECANGKTCKTTEDGSSTCTAECKSS